MPDTLENPRAVIGGNQPPEPTPFEAASEEIANLYGEAKLWLDGAKVDSQDLADGLSNLLNMLRAAWRKADEARKVEKKPHDEAAKAVQEKYKPLLSRVELAEDACKKAIAPWLAKLEAEKRAAADAARKAAEEKTRLAEEAIRAADTANLDAREAAEALVKDAKKAERAATKASNEKPQAGGLIGRAIGLRTVHKPAIVDPVAAARHYWTAAREEMSAFILTLVERDVRAGKRDIPGVEITEEKVAV